MNAGQLRLAGLGSLGGAQLQVTGRIQNPSQIVLDNNFDPSSILNATNFGSQYALALGFSQPFFNVPLNMQNIGDGRAFLTSGVTTGEDASLPESPAD